ncbi:MAG TPA: family 78 glycoside hydrolase catalytic domain [Terracidiphilus sp.]|nr:family 78 glycoside hydrolase catalytic domain [Terracidiphilus sp.]
MLNFARLVCVSTMGMSAALVCVAAGPVRLQVDNLTTPLGIDDAAPNFSWQLDDLTRGAKQTAYEVQVATSAELLAEDKPDVWDSKRVEGGKSLNVRYGGKLPESSKRYFWRVKIWGARGEAYPASEVSCWETGLMSPAVWRANWIGYETVEESEVRHAPSVWITNPDAKALNEEKGTEQDFAYRTKVLLEKPAKHATLYATAQDTVAAWVNGTQVLTADPLPPYKQMPWKKFVKADVTKQLGRGANSLAIEDVHYVVNPNGMATEDPPPMMASLFVEFVDGTTATFVSGGSWKTATHAASGWEQKGFNDAQWKNAVIWRATPNSEPLGHPWIPDSVKELRHTFDVASPVKSARLYATALGTYEMFLNGKRVGQDFIPSKDGDTSTGPPVMAPGWTDYRERVMYQTYDVTKLVTQGKNAIGVLLAPGWYETPLEWFQMPNDYGVTPPALRAQLRIEHADGSVEWVNTSAAWTAKPSYILHSELYDGEAQDLRLIEAGWDTAKYEGSGWKPTLTIDPQPMAMMAQDFEPIRVEKSIPAKAVTEPKPGVYVFDFGQNMSGVEELKVEGPAGTDVRLRFAEILNDDGTIYIDNLRTAKATDHVILNGKGTSDFIPQFTFHGFRYAEVTGLPGKPSLESMRVLVLHTAAPFAAELKTGSPMINQLWSNIEWGQRSNFVGLPTDCPQRDERLGWMADAQVFWRTATYNMDLAAFTRKFAGDMRGTQVGTAMFGIYAPGTARPNMGTGAGWSDAGVIIPWTSWIQTGDTSVISQNWVAMERYLEAIRVANPDGLWKNQAGTPFGDWLSPEGPTDYGLVATAEWAYDLTLMRQMAHATGRLVEEQKYSALFERVRAAFEKEYVRDDGFVKGGDNSPSPFGDINNPNAKSKGGDTQTGYVLALHMNLLPDALRAKAAQKLVDKIEANHGLLATGFLGTPYLLEELTKTGHADVAYHLLLNTQYPSWGYLIDHGATTTWERWNGDQMKDDPSMNSYNHYAYGAVADWIYRYAAGVDTTPLDAGFHTVVLHPVFDGRLGSVDFSYPSSYGVIRSSWTVQGSTAQWQVTIPANTTGRLDVTGEDAVRYTLEGAELGKSPLAHAVDGKYELESGSYSFTVALQ